MLSLDQKKSILVLLAANDNFYKNFPNLSDCDTTPEYYLIEDWLSQILGLNFRKDIYENRKVLASSCKLQKEEDKTYCIGSILKNIIYDAKTLNPRDYDVYKVEEMVGNEYANFLELTSSPLDLAYDAITSLAKLYGLELEITNDSVILKGSLK